MNQTESEIEKAIAQINQHKIKAINHFVMQLGEDTPARWYDFLNQVLQSYLLSEFTPQGGIMPYERILDFVFYVNQLRDLIAEIEALYKGNNAQLIQKTCSSTLKTPKIQ
ncbi:MAG: hypothetical protein MUE85_12210 [Microscillaceae bacterium]|jgi:hypothetical protein|nr:hypothetical protein [Microscillaceae bacterium]